MKPWNHTKKSILCGLACMMASCSLEHAVETNACPNVQIVDIGQGQYAYKIGEEVYCGAYNDVIDSYNDAIDENRKPCETLSSDVKKQFDNKVCIGSDVQCGVAPMGKKTVGTDFAVEMCSSCEKKGEVRCADDNNTSFFCVDLTKNANHCGQCGKECNAGYTCQNGQCEETETICKSPNKICDNECVSTFDNAKHCGECNTPCNDGEYCMNSTCRKPETCVLPMTICEDKETNSVRCVDVQNDTLHCGTCNHACPDDFECHEGKCTAKPCEDDAPVCFKHIHGDDVSWVDENAYTDGDVRMCMKRCTIEECYDGWCGFESCQNPGEICPDRKRMKCDLTSNQCVCEAGTYRHDSKCLDPNENASCGASADSPGVVCIEHSKCNGEKCVCEAGYTLCTYSDAEGNDFEKCMDFNASHMTSCTSCKTNYYVEDGKTHADGCTVNYDDDIENCGEKGHQCPEANADQNVKSVQCKAGKCIVKTCSEHYADCNGIITDGCEASLDSNENCGGCGVKCGFIESNDMFFDTDCKNSAFSSRDDNFNNYVGEYKSELNYCCATGDFDILISPGRPVDVECCPGMRLYEYDESMCGERETHGKDLYMCGEGDMGSCWN